MTDSAAIEQFKAITGADETAASFYLDSAKGDINVCQDH